MSWSLEPDGVQPPKDTISSRFPMCSKSIHNDAHAGVDEPTGRKELFPIQVANVGCGFPDGSGWYGVSWPGIDAYIMVFTERFT
jgi:hypothetical protein